MRIISLILVICLPLIVQAQQLLIPTANHWQLVFIKQDITWDWRGNYKYIKDPFRGPGITLRGNLSSNLLSPNKFSEKRRDEHNLDGFFYYKTPSIYHGLYTKSWLLADRQYQVVNRNRDHLLGLRGVYDFSPNTHLITTRQYDLVNQFSNHALGYKGIYNFSPYLSLSPYAGYQRSENRSIIEWGWDVGVRGDIKDYSLGDYNTDLQLASDYDFYQHRKNYFNSIDLSMKTAFSAKAGDSISVGYRNENQQYFTTDTEYLVNVKIENKRLDNVLYYSLTNRSQVVLNTHLLSRNIFDDTPNNVNDRDVMRIENRLNYQYVSSRFLLMIGLRTFSETQDNLGFATDSDLRHTSLNTHFFYDVGDKDHLDLELNYIKFQYDTPDSTTNHDDRDEIRFIGLLTYSHIFSPLLRLNIEAYANLHHKIYIYRQQSANNNWNRIYRLGAAVSYVNKKWRNTLITQVLANYTVYDFEEIFRETRSFVFREYIIADSLEIPLYSNLVLGLYGRIELKDTGTFYKDEFSEKIWASAYSGFYDFYIRKENILNLDVTGGVAIYRREGFRHIPDLNKVRDIHKVSPYFSLVYPFGKNIRFVSNVSITYLNDIGRQYATYTTGNLNLYYVF